MKNILSKTSKMPCYSFNLPAAECKTGSKLAKIKGSVCNGCYALKGFYRMPVVKKAMNVARQATIINVGIAVNVGTNQLKTFHIGNIKEKL